VSCQSHDDGDIRGMAFARQ
ncbi:hypothetical protein EC940618_4122, partial [Escherichia coli 94.0618]